MSLATAIRTGDLAELPSKRDEDWRWTDLRGLLRQLPPRADRPHVETPGPFAAIGGEVFLIPNGYVEGFTHIRADPGETVVAQLRFIAADPASNDPTVVMRVRPGGRLILLESYEALADGAVSAVDLDIQVEEGGALERIVIAEDRAESVTVSTARVELAAGSNYAQTVLTCGAKRQRIETRVAHPGHGAAVRMDGAYVVSGKRHADITTVVEHNGVDGVTTQLTKGVVRDQGRGVFQGRIVVAEGADRTDARMGHHALILSERAEVDARPELLIFADDVQCAHGNTIGALDEEAVFYARQRGVPDAQARAMLTEAFIGEVIDRIGHEGAREAAHAWATRQLGGG